MRVCCRIEASSIVGKNDLLSTVYHSACFHFIACDVETVWLFPMHLGIFLMNYEAVVALIYFPRKPACKRLLCFGILVA